MNLFDIYSNLFDTNIYTNDIAITMATAAFTVRMDEDLKINFEKMCESFGISMTAAINLFATAVVNERRIPFEIRSKSRTREEVREALESARAHVLSKYPNGMTLDEINAIIDEARRSD